MKNTYECMVLLDNREVKKGWEDLKAVVTGLFDKHGAEVVSARRWDERRLTFPIKRQKRATYLLMYFNADTPQIQAIRRDMEFNEAVLRNFIMRCESIPEQAFEPEAAFDVAAIRVDGEGEVREVREAKEVKEVKEAKEAKEVAKEVKEAPGETETKSIVQPEAGEAASSSKPAPEAPTAEEDK